MRQVNPDYNPVIGYLLLDGKQRVIGPPGTKIDPAFYSEARALQAAAEYGRAEEVRVVAPLYLGGVLSVVREDVGDILLDGRAAKRLVKACQRRGIRVKRGARQRVRETTRGAVYSSRALLGEGES